MTTACGVETQWIVELVNEGVLTPQGSSETAWRFMATDLIRVRKLSRLTRDFEASMSAAAVMLDLIEEVAQLRTRLIRAGLSPD
jgi:chaperone modulatory protein CbpM